MDNFEMLKKAYEAYLSANQEVKKVLFKEAANFGFTKGAESVITKQADEGYGLGTLLGTGAGALGLGALGGYGLSQYMNSKSREEEEAAAEMEAAAREEELRNAYYSQYAYDPYSMYYGM